MVYRHTPGYAVWKFVFPNDIVIYRRNNRDALKYYSHNIQLNLKFNIYTRSQESGWTWIARAGDDKCRCGREYTDTFNGIEFKWNDSMLKPTKTVQDLTDIFQTPTLCQICHYHNEYRAGRFCPKWVKQQLGVE